MGKGFGKNFEVQLIDFEEIDDLDLLRIYEDLREQNDKDPICCGATVKVKDYKEEYSVQLLVAVMMDGTSPSNYLDGAIFLGSNNEHSEKISNSELRKIQKTIIKKLKREAMTTTSNSSAV
jgi:hypothetical protein